MFGSAPFLLGHYCPLDSYLHRLDTRSKLVPVMIIMVLGLMADSIWFHLIILAMLLLGLFSSGVKASAIWCNFKPILTLVGITFLYHILFTGSGGRPVLEFYGLALTEEALSNAVFFSLRLFLFVGIVFLVTLTSSPSDLVEAIARIIRPLEKVKVPVNDLTLMLSIALRFIPILHQEFVAIRNAQLIRGVDFSGNLIDRIKRTTTIVVPVLMAALSRADQLAMAMEARGYAGDRKRSFYSKTVFDSRAWLFTVLSSLVLFSIFWLTGY